MSARQYVSDYWDDLLAKWVAGDRDVPADLKSWYDSYRGSGRGQVVLDAFPEPYLGPLAGERPALALLGLNPGRAAPAFQAPDGIFTEEIRHTSYSRWAAGAPYSSPAWEEKQKTNRYHASRLRFARTLLERPDLGQESLTTFELYPWHSTAVTAAMSPPHEVLERFVWAPLREMDRPFVFAFGKPWVQAGRDLGLGDGKPLDVAWSSPNRSSRTYQLPHGPTLVVIHQLGYAGPPSPSETDRLRKYLGLAR